MFRHRPIWKSLFGIWGLVFRGDGRGHLHNELLGGKRRVALADKSAVLVYVESGSAFGTRLISLEVQRPSYLACAALRAATFQHRSIIEVGCQRVNQRPHPTDFPSTGGQCASLAQSRSLFVFRALQSRDLCKSSQPERADGPLANDGRKMHRMRRMCG